MSRSTPNGKLAGNTDTSFLKILALVFMLIDHMGVVIFSGVMEFRVIGRMAFPLYAWCLVVGSVKTHNPLKYAMRLLIVALVSQPLYMLALNHTWTDFGILFTLLIALVAIEGIRIRRLGSEIWVPVLCYVLLGFIDVDYGWKGLTFILLLYMARETRSGLAAAFLGYALFWGTSTSYITTLFGYKLPFLSWPGIGTVLTSFFRLQTLCWLALPLILVRMKTGIKLPKWLGYGFYPLHLIVLIVMRLLNGETFATLMKGF